MTRVNSRQNGMDMQIGMNMPSNTANRWAEIKRKALARSNDGIGSRICGSVSLLVIYWLRRINDERRESNLEARALILRLGSSNLGEHTLFSKVRLNICQKESSIFRGT